MADGGLSAAEGAWDGFLDWCEERGLGLRGIADGLEEKGIPSLPVFLLVALFLLLALWFVAVPLVFGAQVGEVRLLVKDADGNALPGVEVKLSSTAATHAFSMLSGFTDALGQADFRNVPVGEIHATALFPGYEQAEKSGEILSGKSLSLEMLAIKSVQKTVSVHLSVSGATDASKTKVELQDEFYNPVSEQSGFNPVFTVNDNTAFNIKVTSPGYREELLLNQKTQASDVFLGVIEMRPLSLKKVATVRVHVVDRASNPVSNATAEILSASTGVVVANLSTSDDGRTAAAEMDDGAQVKARVTKNGYSAAVSGTVMAGESTVIEVRLSALDEAEKLFVEVYDELGRSVDNPLVRLYEQIGGQYLQVSENKPNDGKTSFRLDRSREYAVSAWAQGFLPKFFAKATPGTRVIQLSRAGSDNSARLKVHAVTFDGADASGASVALFSFDGSPLGLAEKTTGADGVQFFDNAPRGQILVKADGKGRKGEVLVTLANPDENTTVVLQRASGTVKARATDLFSGKPVLGAVVTVQAINSSSCTTEQTGECTLTIAEYPAATAAITAVGYDDFVSSKFAVTPNSQYALETPLFPSSVRATTKLEFIGVFDARGNKMTSLAPATQYKARFLLRSPPTDFTQAQALVFVGKRQDSLDAGTATISSFDSHASRTFAGTGFELAASLPLAGADNETGVLPTNAALAASPGVSDYKWVHSTFSPFKGTREIAVNIQTKPIESGTVEIHYSTAFAIGGQVVRNPDDAEAGIKKSDLLANDYVETLPIRFEGKCSGEACVQVFFEDASGRRPLDGYEAGVATEFQLAFKALAGNASLVAQFESNSISIGVLRAESGSVQATPQTDAATGAQTVTIPVTAGEGRFFLRGQRISNGAQIKFSLKRNEATAFDKTAFVRVTSPSAQTLRVASKPNSLIALQPTAVEFTVTDSNGLPVKQARITLGSVDDAIGRPIDAIELDNGKYSAQEVTAAGAGTARLSVEAAGFATYRTTLRVDAKSLLELRQDKVELNVRSRDEVIRGEFSANNLLDNEVTATLFLVKQGTPEILDLSVDPVTVRVGRKGSLNGYIQATIADYVMGVAQRATSLNETILGKIVITARTGASRQTLELPFSATAALSQLPIDGAWSSDSDKVEFKLSAPDSLTQIIKLKVTNAGPHPLLFNQQLNAQGVRISPLSYEVLPGDEATFELTAAKKAPQGTGCVFDDVQTKGELSIIASFQGIKSKRTIPVEVNLMASGSCLPNAAQKVSLPVAMTVELPANTKTRKNDDGTTVVLLPDNSIVVFSQAAVTSGSEVDVPAGEAVIVDGKFASSSADGSVRTVSYPFDAVLKIQAQTQVAKRDDKSLVILGSTQMALPQTLMFTSGKTERQVRVPAGTRLEFTPIAEFDTSTSPEITLPAKLTLRFPANTITRTSTDGRLQAQLAGGQVFDFAQEAILEGQNADGSATISAPIASSVRVPATFYGSLPSKGFSLKFPFATDIEVSSDTEIVERQGHAVAFLVDYDAVLPSGTKFSSSAGGKKASLAANSLIEFHLLDGTALAANNQYTLPIDLIITIPGDARVDETASAKTVELATGGVLGLPSEAVLGTKQVDGSRTAQIPAGSKFSAPSSYATNLPRGGFRLSLPIQYAVGVPSTSRVIDRATTRLIILAEFDVTIPAGATLTEKEGMKVSSLLKPGSTVTITPPPSISLSNTIKLTLPFDVLFKLPPEARVRSLSETTAVLLPGNRVMGMQTVTVEGNNTLGKAPAGTQLALSPEMVLQADNTTTTMSIPLEHTLYFESEAQVLRSASAIQIIGRGYKATLPAGAKLGQTTPQAGSDSNAVFKTALIQPSSKVSVVATDFNVLGEERTLPVPLSFRIPDAGFVKTRDDGRTYFEYQNAKMVLGVGTVVDANLVSIPAGTGIVFSAGLFAPAAVAGIPLSVKDPQNHKLTLPFPYAFTLAPDLDVNDTAMGKAVVVQGILIIFPADAKVSQPKTNATQDLSKTVEIPAKKSTLFLSYYKGLFGFINSGANETQIFNSSEARAAFYSRNNKVVILPMKMDLVVPNDVNTTPAYGGTAIWLDEEKVIIAQTVPSAQLQQATFEKRKTVSLQSVTPTPSPAVLGTVQSGISNGELGQPTLAARVLSVDAGGQLSLPPEYASVSQENVVSFIVPLQTSFTIPPEAEVSQEGSFNIISLANPQVDVVIPASVSIRQSGGDRIAVLPPSTRIELRGSPFNAYAGGVMVRLPVDVELQLPSGTRTSAKGASTLVRFPDGSIAEFQGVVDIAGVTTQSGASTPITSTGTTSSSTSTSSSFQGGLRKLLWQQGTNAQLPPSIAQGDQNGGYKLSLPVPATIIFPQDARITRKPFGIAATMQGGTLVTINANVPVTNGQAGQMASLPAKTSFQAGPFGLDVQGPTVSLPFDVSFVIPQDSMVNENGAGGVVVEFAGGMRAKFATGSLGAGGAGLGGMPGSYGMAGSYGMPQSIGGSFAGNPFAGQAGYSASPTAYGTNSQSRAIQSPRYGQITTSPGLAGAASLNGYAAMGTASSQYFSLPVAWTATLDSGTSPATNPDGSLSIFTQDAEVRFPQGCQPIGGYNNAFATGSSSRSSGGISGMMVPAMVKVLILPSNSGMMGGNSISLPFDLQLTMPFGARMLPIGKDNSRSLYFGPGQAMQFTGGLNIDETSASQGGMMAGQSILIPMGTSFTGQGGIISPLASLGGPIGLSNVQPYQPLSPSITGQPYQPLTPLTSGQPYQPLNVGSTNVQPDQPLSSPDYGTQGSSSYGSSGSSSGSFDKFGLSSARIAIPADQRGLMVGDLNSRINPDGTTSVFVQGKEIKLPSPPQDNGQGGSVAGVSRGQHFDMLPKTGLKAGDSQELIMPVEAAYSIIGGLNDIEGRSAGLGVRKRMYLGSGVFIDFPVNAVKEANLMRVPAGQPIGPSETIAKINSQIDWSFTTPTAIRLTFTEQPKLLAELAAQAAAGAASTTTPTTGSASTATTATTPTTPGISSSPVTTGTSPTPSTSTTTGTKIVVPAAYAGRYGIASGDSFFILPAGLRPVFAGGKAIVTIQIGSTLEMRPKQGLAGGDDVRKLAQDTVQVSLPLDITFSVDSASQIIETGDDAGQLLAVKFTPAQYIVFTRAANYNRADKKVFVPAGTTFNPSKALVPTPPQQTENGFPAGYQQKLRFITPSIAALATNGITPTTEENALVLRLPSAEVRVPQRTIAANSVMLLAQDAIEVSPPAADLSSAGLSPVTIPSKSYYLLPKNAKLSRDASTGVRIARLANGRKIGFGPSATTGSAAVGGDYVLVPADERIYVARNAMSKIAGNGVELRLPLDWGVIGSANSYFTSLDDGRQALRVPGKTLNTIVLPPSAILLATAPDFANSPAIAGMAGTPAVEMAGEATGGTIQFQSTFPPGFNNAERPPQGSRPAAGGARIPLGAPVQLIRTDRDLVEACNGPAGDLETTLAYDPAELDATDSAVIDVQQADIANDNGGTVVLEMQPAYSADIKTKNGRVRLLQLPKAARITVSPAKLESGQGNSRAITLAKGSKISMKVCDPQDPASRTITQYYPARVVFKLPPAPATKWIGTHDVEFPGCASVEVKDGMITMLNNVEKIYFPSTARYLKGGYADQKVAAEVEVPQQTPNNEVRIVLCSKDSASTKIEVGIRLMEFEKQAAPDKFENIDPPKALNVVFDESGSTKTENVWVRNVGPSVYFAMATGIEDIPSTTGKLSDFFIPSDASSILFAKDNKRVLAIAPDLREQARILLSMPSTGSMVDGFGCLKPDLKPVEGYVIYSRGATENAVTTETAKLKVHIEFKANPAKCRQKIVDLGLSRMGGFYATYADEIQDNGITTQKLGQLVSFKGAKAKGDAAGTYSGHTRYVMLVNNRLEQVQVTSEQDQTSHNAADCKLVSKGGALEPISTEFAMQPGETRMVQCTSQKPGTEDLQQGWLTITATTNSPSAYVTTAKIKLLTWNPATRESTYTSSPWGEIAAVTSKSALSQKFSDVTGMLAATTGQAGTNAPAPGTTASTTSPAMQTVAGTPATGQGTGPQTATTSSPDTLRLQVAAPTVVQADKPFSAVSVDLASSSLCEEYYCGSDQVAESIKALATAGKALVQDALGTSDAGFLQRVDSFINKKNGGSGKVFKSIIIQKAADAPVPQASLRKKLAQVFDDWKLDSNSIPIDGEIKKCGIYRAEMELNLDPAIPYAQSRKDFVTKVGVSFKLEMVKPCKPDGETLANAPILIGQPQEGALNPELAIGRRVVWWPQEFNGNRVGKLFSNFKGQDTSSILERIFFTSSMFAIGPYGEEHDANDEAALRELYFAMYKQPMPETQNVFKAKDYDDAAFCANNAWKQATAIIAAGTVTSGAMALATTGGVLAAPATFGSSGAAAGATGIGALLAGHLAASMTKAAILCSLTGIPGGAASGSTCDGINYCLQGAVASIFMPTGGVPSSGAATASQAAGTAAQYSTRGLPLGARLSALQGSVGRQLGELLGSMKAGAGFSSGLGAGRSAILPTVKTGIFTGGLVAGMSGLAGYFGAGPTPSMPLAIVGTSKILLPGGASIAKVYAGGFGGELSAASFRSALGVDPTNPHDIAFADRLRANIIQRTQGFDPMGQPLCVDCPVPRLTPRLVQDEIALMAAGTDAIGSNPNIPPAQKAMTLGGTSLEANGANDLAAKVESSGYAQKFNTQAFKGAQSASAAAIAEGLEETTPVLRQAITGQVAEGKTAAEIAETLGNSNLAAEASAKGLLKPSELQKALTALNGLDDAARLALDDAGRAAIATRAGVTGANAADVAALLSKGTTVEEITAAVAGDTAGRLQSVLVTARAPGGASQALEAAVTRGNTAMLATRAAGVAPRLSLGMLGSAAKFAGMTYAQLLLMMAFHVDVKPVGAEFTMGNGIAVFHYTLEPKTWQKYAFSLGLKSLVQTGLQKAGFTGEGVGVSETWPTMAQVCEGKDGSCSGNVIKVDGKCSPDNGFAACTTLVSRKDGKGYLLIASVNELSPSMPQPAGVVPRSDAPAGAGGSGPASSMQAIRKAPTASSQASGSSASPAAAQVPVTKTGEFDYQQVAQDYFKSLFDPNVRPVSKEFALGLKIGDYSG